MSATRNDITGDVIASKVRSADDMEAYRSNWDKIFGKGKGDVVDRKPEPERNDDRDDKIDRPESM